MEMTVDELAGGFTRARLVGRMDIDGAMAIDEPFRALGRLRRRLVVDLTEVSFMASLGLRTIVVAARSLSEIGGRMTLACPQPNVEKVLETSGIGEMVGVHPTVEAAVEALAA